MLDSAEIESLAGGFDWRDWGVVLALFALTHWIGRVTSRRPATIREFFLGGRKLPWYAVSASIIATEISAVTLISLPAAVYRTGGNLTYLQLGLIGLLLARWIVALFLIPRYFEREIYSPYDYMGARLGAGVRPLITVVFSIGGVLGQAARVYLTGIVLELILHDEFAAFERSTGVPGLVASIAAIGAIAVLWTWLGGMTTVIWTDAVLFFVFLSSIAVALCVAVAHVAGGAVSVVELGREADKLRFFDFEASLTKPYTIWAAVIANTFVGVGVFGTDQLMAQRVFCCRNERDAQKAMLASYASMIVAVLVAGVGLALYAYYEQHPLGGRALELVTEKNDRIFPVFIRDVLPHGTKGLIIAGVFAAAISSLDSILAALSQTVLSAFYVPWRERRGGVDERRALLVSKGLVLVFGVLLCVIAVLCEQIAKDPRFASVLDLALSMPGYTQGALLAGFVLAWFRFGVDGSGLLWSAPLSMLTVFAVAWQAEWARSVVWVSSLALVVAWSLLRVLPWLRDRSRESRESLMGASLCGAVGLALPSVIQGSQWTTAWPWFVPVGCAIATLFGYLLAARGKAGAR